MVLVLFIEGCTDENADNYNWKQLQCGTVFIPFLVYRFNAFNKH